MYISEAFIQTKASGLMNWEDSQVKSNVSRAVAATAPATVTDLLQMCNKSQALPLRFTLCSQVWIRSGLTVTSVHFFTTATVFHFQLRVKAHSLPLSLSPLFSSRPLFYPSLFLMMCHCANEEEQEEKGEMHLGHRRPCISSLHSATKKRKLICGLLALPFPLALSRCRRTAGRMDEWTDGYAHAPTHAPTHTHSPKRTVFICLLDQVSSEQSSRCTYAEVHFPAPESQFCIPAAASKHFPKL